MVNQTATPNLLFPGMHSAHQIVSLVKDGLSEPIVFISRLAGNNILQKRKIITSVNSNSSTRPKIRVKIKLMVNPVPDLLSHTFLPPTPRMPKEVFDPQRLLKLGSQLHHLLQPTIKALTVFVNAVLWQQLDSDGYTRLKAEKSDFVAFFKNYAVFVCCIALGFRWTLLLFHAYLVKTLVLSKFDWGPPPSPQVFKPLKKEGSFFSTIKSIADGDSGGTVSQSPRRRAEAGNGTAQKRAKAAFQGNEPHLNVAINWVVKKFGNKLLDSMQTDLRNFIDLLVEVKSIFDGSNPQKTNCAILALFLSAALCYLLPLQVICCLYLSLALFFATPIAKRMIRICSGLARGITTVLERQRMQKLSISNYEMEKGEKFE